MISAAFSSRMKNMSNHTSNILNCIEFIVTDTKMEEEEGGEITSADCPPSSAPAYPGKYGKNNKSGSLLTREQFLEDVVRRWVEHFQESDKYENTSLAHKARYLIRHLKAFKVDAKKARSLIVKVESYPRREDAEQEREGLVEGGNEDDGGGGEGGDVEVQENIEVEEVGGGGDREDADMDFEENEDEENDQVMESEEEEDLGGEEGSVPEERRAEREFQVRLFLEKSDDELFVSGIRIPECVTKSVKFKKRQKAFISRYLEDKDFQSSQDILECLSQAPPVLEETLKQKLSHLTKQEKAARLLLKTLSDTIARLKEVPGREARKQVQIIMAAISHHR